ncbi:hypothetical protein [Hydrogenophaga sp.]|uniref:hypothetical protein n=1 Tax=Hydrogenophaga sp. TaxID=1904254 RepID=UPI0026062138|nr:hypothetical protein [Hydrogenophaga sp.]
MPYAVDIDMSFQFYPQRSESDGPAAAAVEGACPEARHWLLGTVYGRDLLKAALRLERPDLVVPEFKTALLLDPQLDAMIDKLGIRHWQRPASLVDRGNYLRVVMRMVMALSAGPSVEAAALAT